jgi:hypothetical protein
MLAGHVDNFPVCRPLAHKKLLAQGLGVPPPFRLFGWCFRGYENPPCDGLSHGKQKLCVN